MSFKKSFYDQFGEEIDEEVVNYKAKGEKRRVGFRKCKHKQAKVVDGELRCSCGAAWSGPRIAELLKVIKGA